MNIFALEYINDNDIDKEIDWIKSAQSLDNMRVVKMILESCQLLSTALFINNINGAIYKPTHINHPSTKWTAESSANFLNLVKHTKAMLDEYYLRFNKNHKCNKILEENILPLFEKNIDKFPQALETPLKMAMPLEYQVPNDPVLSYRNYYITKEKMRYPKGKEPIWFLKNRKIPYKAI